MSKYSSFARLKTSFRSQIFRGIASNAHGMLRDGAVSTTGIIQSRSMVRRKLSGLQVHVSIGQGVLNALILANRSSKDNTFLSIF